MSALPTNPSYVKTEKGDILISVFTNTALGNFIHESKKLSKEDLKKVWSWLHTTGEFPQKKLHIEDILGKYASVTIKKENI